MDLGSDDLDRPDALAVTTWPDGRPDRRAVRSVPEGLDAWLSSGAASAVMAMDHEELSPDLARRPPVAGLVVTLEAARAYADLHRPEGSSRSVSFSRLVVEILLDHPEGIQKDEIFRKVVMMSGRTPTPQVVAYALRRFGRQDRGDPRVWTALPTTEVLKTGRSDPHHAVAHPATHAYPHRRKAAPVGRKGFDWTPQTIEQLRTLVSSGLTSKRVAEEIGGGLTRSAVISKARRLGLSLGANGAAR